MDDTEQKWMDIKDGDEKIIMLKIAYFLRDRGACGYYRVELPLRTMSLQSDMFVERIWQGIAMDNLVNIVGSADILTIPRLCETNLIVMASLMQKEGKKIVIDHDDNMFAVSPFSNHYEDCGTEDITVIMQDGSSLELWKDGKNIDLKANRARIDNFKKALEMADMVTTTTDILADVYKEYNDNVVVLPNCVDMNLWQRLPLMPHKGLRMCWFGGSSHYEDWTLLEDVLPVVMQKYPELILVIMGQKFEGTLKKLPKDRIEFHWYVDTAAYPYKAAILDCDFAIIPLRATVFNKCKSNIKWVEQGALSIPSVTSYVSPYMELAKEDNGIFIEDNSTDAWIEGISKIIEDKQLRLDMGTSAYKTVAENFDINNQWHRWFDAYKSLSGVIA